MTNNNELAQLKQLATFMTERFSMNPVSCKILNEDWKKRFPDDAAVAETLVALLAERDADKIQLAELESKLSQSESWSLAAQKYIAYLESQAKQLVLESDADKKRIAELNDTLERECEKSRRMASRIAELEALTAEQDKRLITYAAIATKNAAEARTVSVKLPPCVDDLHGVGMVMSADAVTEALSSAGIKLEVGE